MKKYYSKLALSTTFFILTAAQAAPPGKNKITDSKAKVAAGKNAVLWVAPTDLESRNLYFGSGRKEHAPKGSDFTFVDEDRHGTNPKFNVTDAEGVKWKVKLGAEAGPETAAARLVWAVGYFANEDYFLAKIHVKQLPASLHRGQNLIGPDGEMKNVRLKRHLKHEDKAGNWKWRDDPFTDRREWNGLRVMMALMNNWDLKDDNNAIYEKGDQKIYLISDLGASFGTTGYNPIQTTSKGNLGGYRNSHFIVKTTSQYVDFGEPSRPALPVGFNVVEFKRRMALRWLGKQIPREDARWMGQILARLSPQQIRDAFRAAGYEPAEVEGFAQVIETRIAALRAL